MEKQGAEIGKTERRRASVSAPDWWVAVPQGEKILLQTMAGFLRSARRSPQHEVARAAAKWERSLGCFIKVRLTWENQKSKSGSHRWRRHVVDINYMRIEGPKVEKLNP